jgi:hypothetical protein
VATLELRPLTAYCPVCLRLRPIDIVKRVGPALCQYRTAWCPPGARAKLYRYTPEDAPGEQVTVSCADCLHEWVIVRERERGLQI